MKRPKIRLAAFFLLLFLLLAVTIALFSHQPGEESSILTNNVMRGLQNTRLDALTPQMKVIKYDEYRSVRKWGHIYLFAALGFCAACVGRCLAGWHSEKRISRPVWREWMLPLAASVGYACVDEWHQTFVAGREGSLRDVCFDTAGIVMGICAAAVLTAVIRFLVRRLRKRTLS